MCNAQSNEPTSSKFFYISLSILHMRYKIRNCTVCTDLPNQPIRSKSVHVSLSILHIMQNEELCNAQSNQPTSSKFLHISLSLLHMRCKIRNCAMLKKKKKMNKKKMFMSVWISYIHVYMQNQELCNLQQSVKSPNCVKASFHQYEYSIY